MSQKEIEAAALAQIAAMFQRPSQLEKIDELKKRADRKRAAVDAMLRTSVQSQLEGIRSAVKHLQTASEDVSQIQSSMTTLFDTLKSVSETKVKLKNLSNANFVHSQYATAMDNLNHIFNLEETIEKTNEFIKDGKLLQAHKNIMDLEKARDDLMFEVHKLDSEKQEYDKNLLKTYFTEVERLVNDLSKEIFYFCSRALEIVHGQDNALKQLVSSIRIIEREERIDQFYIEQRLATNNFMPPGRPRKWRKRLFEILKKNVEDRLLGNQLEDRSINPQWLVRYLEATRRCVVDDLKIIKNCLTTSFPSEYSIYDRYIKYYHDGISNLLKDIADDKLEKNELVHLLSWIQAYPGETMLGTPQLKIQAYAMVQENPLLPKPLLNKLYDDYIDLTRRDIHNWLDKALITEKDDWYQDPELNQGPELDVNRCFYTTLPSTLFGIVEDTISLSKEITLEIIPRVVEIAVDEFFHFSNKYKDEATVFKKKHFEDRLQFKKFTSTIIAIANNFDICIENTDKLEKHIRLTMEISSSAEGDTANGSPSYSARSVVGHSHVNRQELIEKIEGLKKKWTNGMQFAISTLFEEIFQDISKFIERLMSRTWLLGSNDLETICATIHDYYSTDYSHLRVHIRYQLIREIFYKVVGEYLIAIDIKRLTFSKYDERHIAAERLRVDSDFLEKEFRQYFEGDYTMPLIIPVLPALADILDLRDKSLLTLETSTFVRKFPDISLELLCSVIQSREDTSKAEARNISEEAISHAKFHPKGDHEIQKLFQMCKSGSTKRALQALPALETTVQSMFATLKATVPK